MDIKYGFLIKETTFRGINLYSVYDARSKHEAISNCVKIAVNSGWDNPRWWQFWRWGDTKVNPTYIRMEKEFPQ